MDSIIGIGDPIPAVQLRDLAGCQHSTHEACGKILVLNFWSAECPWSERADADLLDAIGEWKGQVVLWTVATNANEGDELIRGEAQHRGLPLVLRDEAQIFADQMGALTTPHLFIVDADCRLRYRGALDDVTFRRRIPGVNYVRSAVAALIAGEQPDPAETPPYGCTIVRRYHTNNAD